MQLKGDAPLKTERQTYLQKANKIIVFNDEQLSQISDLYSESKTVKINLEILNISTMTKSVTKNFDKDQNGVFSFNEVNVQIENTEVESNAPKSENQNAKNIVSINQAKECLMNIKYQSSIVVSTELGK